jgi:hypothetical protein
MKITIARKKLQAKGYHVTSVINGGYVAVKGQRRYMATSINGLINQIFKSI